MFELYAYVNYSKSKIKTLLNEEIKLIKTNLRKRKPHIVLKPFKKINPDFKIPPYIWHKYSRFRECFS